MLKLKLDRDHLAEMSRLLKQEIARPSGDDPEMSRAIAQDMLRELEYRTRLPARGTKQRIAFDLMRRPGGVTARELKDATGGITGWSKQVEEWAERYGLHGEVERADGATVYRLIGDPLPGETEGN